MFKLAVDLPYSGTVRVEELTNRQLFTILKYCTAEDMEGFEEYLNETIFSKLPPLNIIDKFYLLLFLRSFYVSDSISIAITHEKVNSMEFYLENMLNKISELKKIDNHTIETKQVSIELGLPSRLYFESYDDIVYDCIQSLQLDGDVYNISKLGKEDKDKIFTSIKQNIPTDITNYFTFINKNLSDIVMINRHEDYGIDETVIKPLSNDPLRFVMIIFAQNISDFLNFMYNYVNKVGGTFKDFLELTFNDSKIMFDFYQEEMIKQNESLNNRES